MKFVADDFCGLMWQDGSGNDHFVSEADASNLANLVNDKIGIMLRNAPTLYSNDAQKLWGVDPVYPGQTDTVSGKVVCIEQLEKKR